MNKKDQPKFTIFRQDFGKSIFPPHGNLEEFRTGQMVVDISTGPFNREIFDLYAQKATPVFQDARQDGPFVLLVIYKESMMMTNEAAEHFVRIAARMVAADIAPVAVAFVVTTDVEGGNLIPGILKTRVYDPFNVPFQVFSVRDDAEKWLNTKLTASSAK